MSERVCTTCVFCLRQDSGYSNWTVEYTYLNCLQGLNPSLDGQESPWGDTIEPKLATALDVAKQCDKYREGAPAWLDVDHESMTNHEYNTPYTAEIVAAYAEDSEVATALAQWLNKE